MTKKIWIICSLLLLPMAWAQGGQARAEKPQRLAARHEAIKEGKPVEPTNKGDPQAQRRADLRAALLAKRPPEQSNDDKHLTPRERIELRQQLRQLQIQRQPSKG